MTKNDKKNRLLYLLELQIFDTQKLAITASTNTNTSEEVFY